jgi:hypothetical protein
MVTETLRSLVRILLLTVMFARIFVFLYVGRGLAIVWSFQEQTYSKDNKDFMEFHSEVFKISALRLGRPWF